MRNNKQKEMESLSNSLQPYKETVGSVASIVTIGQFFSGAFICLDIYKKKRTDGISSMPFVGGTVIGILVLKYALMLQDKAMFQVNLAAIILNSLYLLCYFIYSRNTWEEIYRPCLRGFGLIAALFTYMAWEDPSKVEYRYGLIVTILMLLLMGAPLREVKEILDKKDASSIPFPIVFAGLFVSVLWFLYGIILQNEFMIVQNIIGTLLCATQVLLYFIYPSKSYERSAMSNALVVVFRRRTFGLIHKLVCDSLAKSEVNYERNFCALSCNFRIAKKDVHTNRNFSIDSIREGSAARAETTSTTHGLSKLQAQELILRLTDEERNVLINALQEYHSKMVKEEYEGQLAASRWRSKFGRPSKLPTLGDVDPTGSYCPLPEDWLEQKRDPCLVHYCMKGHECTLTLYGEAICICQRQCNVHRKLVCGSDGHIYPNHCELHRAACLTKTAISVERGVHCVKHGKGWAPTLPHHTNLYFNEFATTVSPQLFNATKASPLVTDANEYESTTSRSQMDSKDDEDEDEQLEEEGTGGENEGEAADDVVGDTSTVPNDVENEVEDEGRRDTKIADDFYQQEGCPMQEYEIMKDNLLLYNHARLMSQDNHSKDYLVSIMFSHYDRNNNGNLEATELNEITAQEHLDTLSKGCTLPDMIQYEDSDRDGKLNINEFYVAFSKLYSVSVVSLDKALETNHLTARVGDNVEIKCDVTGSPVPPIVWRRNQLDLSTLNEEDVRVFSDGSLYLTRIQLQHAGNYTCHAQRNKDVVQTHILTVHTVPEVHVTPRIQSKRPGEDAVMYCHVAGEPFPKVIF
ncbi:Sugar efflux transporter for intercellular exchange [Popillia japonica]|uniref:Sugar transporter SWEET1 n=1 Tax=Popillia japonica TaxID=7064 RepID=A0AAW1IUL6_POPJA